MALQERWPKLTLAQELANLNEANQYDRDAEYQQYLNDADWYLNDPRA